MSSNKNRGRRSSGVEAAISIANAIPKTHANSRLRAYLTRFRQVFSQIFDLYMETELLGGARHQSDELIQDLQERLRAHRLNANSDTAIDGRFEQSE